MKRTLTYLVLIALAATILMSCKKNEFIPVMMPTDEATIMLNEGISGSGEDNIVYMNLSKAATNSLKRTTWDLGFYTGDYFRVIINNTNKTKAKMLDKTDLAAVTAIDSIGLEKELNEFSFSPNEFKYLDDIDGDLNKTVIKSVLNTEENNRVFIIQRGIVGVSIKRHWIKAKVNINNNGAYVLEYGNLTQTTGFKKIIIPKNPLYNFMMVSLEEAAIIQGEPKKSDWDLSWGYAMYHTKFGGAIIPYGFADMIAINDLGGVEAYERIYKNSAERNKAYTAYNRDSVTNTANLFSNEKWVIGANWRSTMPATGVKTDRFYIIKDAAENYYKIKFISMGVNDGGVRGKPVIAYKLIP